MASLVDSMAGMNTSAKAILLQREKGQGHTTL